LDTVRPKEKEVLRHEHTQTVGPLEVHLVATRNHNDHHDSPTVIARVTIPGELEETEIVSLVGQKRSGLSDEILLFRRGAELAFRLYDDAVDRAKAFGTSRPHGRSYPDEFWQEFAEVYGLLVVAELYDPVATFANAADIPIPTVSRWVSTARSKGLLIGAADERSER
jgi:hypothetical protein